MSTKYCPACGNTVEQLKEGYCKDCSDEIQSQLNLHNAQCDFWNSLTDKEREYYIRSAT